MERRVAEHEAGTRGARYLRGRGPLELLLSRPVGDRATALRLEHRVKRFPRSRKLELIAGTRSLDELLPDQVLGSGGS